MYLRNKMHAPNPAFHNPQSTGEPFSERRLGEKGENCSKSRSVGHFLPFFFHNAYSRRAYLLQLIPHRREFEILRLSFQSNTKNHPNVSSAVASRGSDEADIVKIICDDTISSYGWPYCGLIAMVDGHSQWLVSVCDHQLMPPNFNLTVIISQLKLSFIHICMHSPDINVICT